MDYEQKYKEALSRARVVNPGTKDYNIVTTIFPELKESEDKRIRENAIQIIRYSMDGTDVALPLNIYKECINWLEKQGEPINKEPKFKVDNFIVHNNSGDVCQVTEIKDEKYCIWPLYAEIEGYLNFIDVDNDYRLWTIQDAKKGDILQANKCTLIFDSLTKDIDGNTVISSWYYCDTKTFYGMGTCKPDLWIIDGVVPATKEQCNLLFQKMKEAGYKWDIKEKKLTKL